MAKEGCVTEKMAVKKRHQPFKEWHHDNLVQFLDFIEVNYPEQVQKMLDRYDEWLGGN